MKIKNREDVGSMTQRELALVDFFLKEQQQNFDAGRNITEDFFRCYDLEYFNDSGYSIHYIIWYKKGHMSVGIPIKTFIVKNIDNDIVFSAAYGRGCKYRSEYFAKEACLKRIEWLIENENI